MPSDGLRLSRKSGSALLNVPYSSVFGRAGGGVFISKPTRGTSRSCRKLRTALMWQYLTNAAVS